MQQDIRGFGGDVVGVAGVGGEPAANSQRTRATEATHLGKPSLIVQPISSSFDLESREDSRPMLKGCRLISAAESSRATRIHPKVFT